MNEAITQQQLRQILKEQLECDLFLGAKWLPIGKLTGRKSQAGPSKSQAASPPEIDTPGTLSSPADMAPTAVIRPTTPDSEQLKRQRMDGLVERIKKCMRCPLYQTRTNVVPGEGHLNTRLVFIGEAPGADEDAQGRPFVGRAGKLLTNIIQAMGLKRQDVFIGNILKSRPPDNREPSGAEITACIDFLYEQLDIIEPELIVALGAYAARTLLNSTEPIGHLRGRVHEYYPHPLAKPIKLIATYHPAYLLRNYTEDSRRRVWEDMQMVLRELNLPIPKKS